MEIYENESIAKYTTVRIGGIAKFMYFPENNKELIDVIDNLGCENVHIIGGGSNLLVNDKREFDHVINLRQLDKSITKLDDGKYYVGASVALQKLINIINDDGYGGIEYLFSVPALVGGAIVMNAGRGKKHNMSISDYIVDVKVYNCERKEIQTITKSNCLFSYRNSKFKGSNLIILGVTFEFETVNRDESKKRKKDRVELVKRMQDNSGSNFGSVFSENNKFIMEFVKLTHPGFSNGMEFSRNTRNWMINNGDGTYQQAIYLINKVKKWHKFIGNEAISEVIIWD